MNPANLTEFKQKSGVTGRELAVILGISESYLSEKVRTESGIIIVVGENIA